MISLSLNTTISEDPPPISVKTPLETSMDFEAPTKVSLDSSSSDKISISKPTSFFTFFKISSLLEESLMVTVAKGKTVSISSKLSAMYLNFSKTEISLFIPFFLSFPLER